MTTQITANNIVPGTITSTQLTPGSLAPRIYSVAICDSSYNVLDDTAANTSGGYIEITGANFGSNSQIVINGNGTLSATYVNNTTLRAQVGAISSGTYTMYVVDTDTGATAIRVNGYTTSSFPAWGTGSALSDQSSGTAFGVNLSANSDSSITYANTTALPTGTSLLANGYFYGTVTIGSQTTYNFTVDAKDTENQDALRTFSMTVTVTPQGKLYAWGFNGSGQAGVNNTNNTLSPTQLGTDTNWSSIGSENQTFAVKTDGTLWGWGYNVSGQLGQNDKINRSSPTQIGSLTNWSKVCSGKNLAMALKTDGTLWLWGANNYGQLGTNNRISYSSPVQIGSSTNWSSIPDNIFYFTAAIKTDGSIWTWGYAAYGLGLGDNSIDRSSPTQIGSLTDWRSISTGRWQFLATKTDGTLWAWGRGAASPLNTNLDKLSPVQVGTGTNWNLASVGQYHALATKTNGTLWSWGQNQSGQLGLNNSGGATYTSSPTQVGSGTDWKLISAGVYTCMATKTNNTLWWWGNGTSTPFGTQTYTSSPTQVGAGTGWILISAGGGYQHCAVSST